MDRAEDFARDVQDEGGVFRAMLAGLRSYDIMVDTSDPKSVELNRAWYALELEFQRIQPAVARATRAVKALTEPVRDARETG